MARNNRGKRDGSGPYRDSDQARGEGRGRRKAKGEPCPRKKR